ncbi:MAG: hypothetical protein K0R67_1285 [Paenibacillus sp.]|jgi:hypothetical protein|nr:hypothetical protein [Paenibacillus sp.]
MNSTFEIPNGEDKIMIELTVKEALALSGGSRFLPKSNVALSAKRKLRRELEHKLLPESEKIHYYTLDI